MVRVVYQLRRGSLGLGIDVSGRNEVVKLMPNGQAAVDGLALVGDIVEAVDSRPLQGRRLQDAMVPGQRVYELIVQRNSVPLEAAVARSFSPVPLLRCLELQVSRGPKGLGIDIGNVASVRGLIPGGMAEREGVLLPGDLVIAVDRVMVGPQGLKPLIAPGRSVFRFMLLRPDVVASQTTAVIGAEQFVAAIEQLATVGEEATSRARAAVAEAERAHISRAAAAAASQSNVPPEGVNLSSVQADQENATSVSEVTEADVEDLESAPGAPEATAADVSSGVVPSFSLVIEQAAAATQKAQMAGQRLDADSKDSRTMAGAERAVTTTAQSLAARPRNLSNSELRFLQQDKFVDSASIESERHLATERAAQLEKLASQLVTAKSGKLAASDAAESKAAIALREQAEPSPSGMPQRGETKLDGKEELRSSTTPTPTAAPTTSFPTVWGAAASAARGFLWGTNAATPAAKQESHELTSSCPQRVQPLIAVKSISAAQNPMRARKRSEDERDGAEEGLGPLVSTKLVSTKTSEHRSAAQLAVLWDIETCPLPSDTDQDCDGGAVVSGAMESVSRRWEGIAGWRARIGPVIVYGSTGDVHAATRDLAYGSTVKHGADSADRVGAMLTDLLVHVLDHPSTAILLITNQSSVLAAAVQLAARGFGVSVALPDGFDPGSLPSSERVTLLRGLYCWPQLLPYTPWTGRVTVAEATAGEKATHQDGRPASLMEESLVVEQEQTASVSNVAQTTASAPAFPYASFRTATHTSIVLTISSVSTPTASAAASRSHGAHESAPPAEAVVGEEPLAKMIRQAQSLGDDALVAKLQAIGS
jgi:hypothetical protein